MSNPGGLKPANFEELTDEEKQMWKNRNERQPRNRNFQMANLSLLIEENSDDPRYVDQLEVDTKELIDQSTRLGQSDEDFSCQVV